MSDYNLYKKTPEILQYISVIPPEALNCTVAGFYFRDLFHPSVVPVSKKDLMDIWYLFLWSTPSLDLFRGIYHALQPSIL